MDLERALISKVLFDKCYSDAVDEHIVEELFVEHREVWKWVVEEYKKHGDEPPVDFLEERWPQFEFGMSEGSVPFLVEELKKRRVKSLIIDSIRKQGDLIKAKDPMAALDEVRTLLIKADMETRPSRDVNLTENPLDRRKKYDEIVNAGGVTGMPSPWPPLDEETQGFHPEDLIMFAGRAGVGKTFTEMVLARYHWSLGYVPLVFSREMAVWQIIRRIDAINAELPYKRFRGGQLSSDELERWMQALKDMEGGTPFWVSGDDDVLGVSGIEAKIKKYRPHGVYIDGAYLIGDERGAKAVWEKFLNVCWDLKKLARRVKLPIFVTHQFNLSGLGEKGTADTMKFGDVKMWFDLMIGQYQDESMKLNKEMLFKIIKQREGDEVQWVSEWDLDRMCFGHKKSGHDDIPDEAEEDPAVRY